MNNEKLRERERDSNSFNDTNELLDNSLQNKEIRKSHYDELYNYQPFEQKVIWAKKRIEEFIIHCYKNNKKEILLSFSGGKDSTVLFHLICVTLQKLLINNIVSDVYIKPAYAFEITFPETILFIKKMVSQFQQEFKIPNSDKSFITDLYFAKPKHQWKEILSIKGFPIFSKQLSVILNRIKKVKSQNGLTKWIFGINTSRYHITKQRMFLLDQKLKKFPDLTQNKNLFDYFKSTYNDNNYIFSEKCCDEIKGGLKHIKMPTFVGTTTSESFLRKNSWINNGCNIITEKKLISRPISLFKTKDIFKYIIKNKIKINPKYFINSIDCNELNIDFDKKDWFDLINSRLKYKRLGCISCPYGSHMEKEMNRFEILLLENPMLFYAQVIQTGMYKILIDMGIQLSNYPIQKYDWIKTTKVEYEKHQNKYNELFKLRWEQIKKWYTNFDYELADIITQIENYKNYKNYFLNNEKKRLIATWIYDDETLMQIYKNYDLQISFIDFKKEIDKLREQKFENILLKGKTNYE